MEVAMAKKKTPNELYWEMMAKKQIRDEYNQFLQQQGQEGSPHLADVFAMKKYEEGYRDMTKRELILFLAGELPFMYD
jgi:hypothetical protein